MKNRGKFAALVVVIFCLAAWCAVATWAEVSYPILTVQNLYRSLIAGDYEKAVQNFTKTSEGAAGRLRDLTASTDIFGFSPGHTMGSLTGCKSNLKNIGTALEMYSTDNSGRYPRSLSSLSPNYLRIIPTCPAAEKDTYSATFRSRSNPDAYTVICKGKNHADQRLRPDYPQYNSYEGLVEKHYGEGESVSDDKKAGRAVWKMEDFKILGQRITGDTASVGVEEKYSVYGFSTRVRVEIPLRKSGERWLIDGPGLATDRMQAPEEGNEGLTVLWLKSHGFAAAAAACLTEREEPSPSGATSGGTPSPGTAAVDDPEAIVKTLMGALKAKDYVSMLGVLGITLPEEVKGSLNASVAMVEARVFQWRVKDYRILDVKRDGGLAQIVVEETHFKDCPPEIRALIQKSAKSLDEGISWGDNTATETFVLIKLKDKWQFDFSHSGIDLESFPFKDLANSITQSEAPDTETQSRIAGWVNKIGLGQVFATICTAGPATSVMAAILVPNFMRAKQHGQATGCKSNLKNIGTALEMYSTDHSGRYPKSLGELSPNYLRTIPTCPAVERDTYSTSYQSAATPDAYTVFCSGANHTGVGIPPNFPRYDSNRGLMDSP